MAILIDKSRRVLVQGITGREGTARTQLMVEYGTQVVAGVTPGKGRQSVLGVPVFDTVQEACDHAGPIDISVIFVPAPLVHGAALEAIHAGIKLLVLVPDRVPLYDVLDIAAAAKAHGTRFIGPNTLGVLSPGAGVLGMMGGRAESIRAWAKPGPVGITSRSGGITTSLGYYITQAGSALSTLVHVGGDGVVGMTHADILRQFEQDEQTRLVVLFGEIGTSQEEDAAALIESGGFTKPLIAYVGGKAAQEGTRFSHAGAIIEGGRGTHAGKIALLREAGATIAETFADIPRLAAAALEQTTVFPVAQPQPEPAPAAAKTASWYTAITDVQPNNIRVRGHAINTLMGQTTFGQAIYLLLLGELPRPAVGHLLDAILVASIDHGATPPSTLAARTAASTGAPVNAAIAAGLLSINRYHGGAIEACMRMLSAALAQQEQSGSQATAGQVVQAYRQRKERLPGFGHRIHTDDPRAKRLLALAAESDLAGPGVALAQALVDALEQQTGRKLPLNVDGAIAAVLVDLGLPAALGNTFFMMARVPGLVAHIYEEQSRERPMRVIQPRGAIYDGPSGGDG